jgi:hypothetical protein
MDDTLARTAVRSPLGQLWLEILTNTPALPEAECRGQSDIFTAAETDEHARAEALDICGRCACRQRCAEWLASLPQSSRPVGVTAGEVIESRRGRPPGEARKPGRPRKEFTVTPGSQPRTATKPTRADRKAQLAEINRQRQARRDARQRYRIRPAG